MAGVLCEIRDLGASITALREPAGPAVAVPDVIRNLGKAGDLAPTFAEILVFEWPTCRAVDNYRADAAHRWKAVQFGDDERIRHEIVNPLLTILASEMNENAVAVDLLPNQPVHPFHVITFAFFRSPLTDHVRLAQRKLELKSLGERHLVIAELMRVGYERDCLLIRHLMAPSPPILEPDLSQYIAQTVGVWQTQLNGEA